ncbi:TPA: hypothetical protein RQO08_001365 [Klebsiella oxytoca]|nr:hypothetical protein [Klebsiella oxytoca]
MKRGVVTTTGVFVKESDALIIKRMISPLELNYFALYWDEIVMPENSQVRFASELVREMQSCGAIKRFRFDMNVFSADTYASELVDMQFITLDILRGEEKDTDWRIHQIGGEFFYPENKPIDLINRESIRLELIGLLPVPDTNVHFHEILEFKERRAPELAALHSYCDDLYLEILNSADPNLQRARNFSKLKEAIEDLDKLNKQEWQSPIKFNMDISSEFDISNIRAGYAALLSATQSSMPITTAIIGGALSVAEGFVKLKVELRSVRKTNGVNHMMYLSNARREGVI